jgi:hypothetical protein
VETESVTCPACGKPTPDENLRCIFCGELLPSRGGALGGLRYGGFRRWVFIGVVVLVIAYFLRRFF